MPVFFNNQQVTFPKISRRAVKKWITKVVEQYGFEVGDISYIFCSEEEILRINKQYLRHNYFTDIITFDYSENGLVSGDLFISVDTVRSNSKLFDTRYDEELLRVMIHGVLHLCGLKDKSENDAKQMRKAEEDALNLFRQ